MTATKDKLQSVPGVLAVHSVPPPYVIELLQKLWVAVDRANGEGPDAEQPLLSNREGQYDSDEDYEQIVALDDRYVEQATAKSWRSSTAGSEDSVVATETTGEHPHKCRVSTLTVG